MIKMETRRRIGRQSGRPSSATPEKLAVLIAAIEHGFSLIESLQQAALSDDAYRRLIKKSPKFRQEITAAKMKLVMLARSSVARSINEGDMATVRWYLERKCPEEFSMRVVKDKSDNPLPEGTVIVLPGSHPHPRIIPEEKD